jgi:nicotinate phosphoribosyltransferase
MFFDDERVAFDTYARAMPNNCVFLVDTYDTLAGVREAIAIGRELRTRGHEMVGIRLDSGDLAHLSIEARELLDTAGFPDAAIVASNDLDEHIIHSLKEQDATIAVWGVGTKLATAYDQPALGGVYKLAAIRTDDGSWEHKIKLSDTPIKISNPGVLQTRRYYRDGRMVADVIHDGECGLGPEYATDGRIHDIDDPTRTRAVPAHDAHADLLVPVFEAGRLSYDMPDIHAIRAHARDQLERLDVRSRRFLNPHIYPVGLDPTVHGRKLRMVAAARARTAAQAARAAADTHAEEGRS